MRAVDQRTLAIVAVKAFRENVDDVYAIYAEYLTNISMKFRPSDFLHSLLPTAIMKADGYVCQILSFLDGARPVKSIIADRGVYPSLALEITAGVATALTELHESSLIHADLKPSNILLIRSPCCPSSTSCSAT